MRNLLMHSPIAVAVAWIGAYIFCTLLPLLVLFFYPPLPDRGFWLDFSVALGFIALAMMVLQFALTARINKVEASYGFDVILQFHRYISLVAFAFVLIHPLILFAVKPETLQLLNIFTSPWRAKMAVLGTLALIILVVTTIWRQKLNIPYEAWRAAHGVLAVLTVGLGLGHAIGVGNYLGLFWKVVLWTAIALIALWLIVYVRLIKPWLMLKKPYLVEEVRSERGDVWTITLRPKAHKGFQFQPGQFAWLTIDLSPFHMREHPFSMSSNGDNVDKIEFSIKALGDFTKTIKDIPAGTVAFLDGPYGVFTTDRYEDTGGFVLITGGIGITPIISMLITHAERQDSRPYLLIYASKTWEDITFREELEVLQEKLDLKVVHVLKEPPEDWIGESGYVDKELLEKYIPEQRAARQYFLCASPKMMKQVQIILQELEVPPMNVQMEHFNLV